MKNLVKIYTICFVLAGLMSLDSCTPRPATVVVRPAPVVVARVRPVRNKVIVVRPRHRARRVIVVR